VNWGADSLITGANPAAALNPNGPALGRLWRGQDVLPKNAGDWGVAARWSPQWLDGTMGLYYRNSADIQPQAMVTPGLAPNVPPATCTAIGGTPLPGNSCIVNPNVTNTQDLLAYGKLGTYNTSYGTNIHLFGVSLAKSIGGISFGSELSYRENMPLVSDPVTVLPGAIANTANGQIATTSVPDHGTPGARGNTFHGLLNAFAIVPKTPLFDTASLMVELTGMHVSKVTQNEAVYKGRANYTAIDKATQNFAGLAVNFTPTWFQVLPGVDMLMPLSWSNGVYGNAAVSTGGNKGTGNFAAGLAWDIYQKYRVDLKYVGFFGNYQTDANGTMTVPNGLSAALGDRGYVALTLKTTF